MTSHASMNRIYRLVFNAATGMYVAVAETAKGRGKAGRSASAAMLAALTAVGGLGGLSNAGAQSTLPTGGVVTSGAASISQTGNAMTVNQNSNAAILNWQNFSIGAGNSVHFVQPSVSSIALNRVIGNSASEILGNLSANGKVMLVNQNGILMGSGAQVDTGGFIGSTLNIKDSDFLAGKYIFDIANNTGDTAGSIINNGRIASPSGYAVLIAPQIANNGFIAARAGTVAVGAGNKVSLDMVGDGLISIKVDQAALNAAIVNTGTIEANGGTVLIKASSANALFDTVINSTGIIRADSISTANGRIILDGGSTGITEVTGEITARGQNSGKTGGSISVLGDKVGLLGSGKLDASGDAGGGTVLVGGAWQGNGPERNASRTIVGSNASIDVSATGNGNGGTAVVWADGRTDMSGTIKATGGINGGNGGNVETSGKAALDLQGRVDIAAVTGKGGAGGQWLLDPNNILISNATANTTITGTTYQDDAGANMATIDAAALGAALTGGNTVNVQTSNAGTAGTFGEIRVIRAITATGAGTLNLIANQNITLSAAITNAAGSALNVGLYAGSTGTPATIATAGSRQGAITTDAAGTITTNGGKVIMVSGSGSSSGLTLGGAVRTTNGDVTLNAGGALAVNRVINAGTGTVRLQSAAAITQVALADITAANLGARGTSVDLSLAANSVSTNVGINASAGNVLYKSTPGFALGAVTQEGTLFGADTAGFTAIGNNVTINSAGAVTQATGNNVTATGLLIGGAGAFTLTNATNSVGTIAALTGAGAVQYVNAGALTVGTVGTTNGITRTGNVSIKAQTGDLTLANNVTVSNAVVRLQAAAGKVEQTAGVINTSNLSVNAGDGDVAMGTTSNNARFVAIMATGDVVYKSAGTYSVDSIGADGPIVGVGGISTSGAGKNITLDTAAGQVVADEFSIRTPSGGLLLKGNATYALTASNNVSTIAAETGAGDISFKNAGALVVGNVGATNGMTRTGDAALQTGGALTQTQAINAANLALTGGQNATLNNAGNNIASLSGSTAELSLTNTGALGLGALTVNGNLTLNTGGTVSQTGALTQTGGSTVNVTATAGTVKLTNTANNVSGMVNLSAVAGGVAFVNNNAAGISEGNITAATSMNTTNAASIANFTASDAALTGVVLLQALQGDIFNGGGNKIVADRAVLVAANRIGGATATDTRRGVRVEGAAGASAREVYVSAGATQMASVFGPAAVPTFYAGLKSGATTLASPTVMTYNGAVVVDVAAAAAAAAAQAAAAQAAAAQAAAAQAAAAQAAAAQAAAAQAAADAAAAQVAAQAAAAKAASDAAVAKAASDAAAAKAASDAAAAKAASDAAAAKAASDAAAAKAASDAALAKSAAEAATAKAASDAAAAAAAKSAADAVIAKAASDAALAKSAADVALAKAASDAAAAKVTADAAAAKAAADSAAAVAAKASADAAAAKAAQEATTKAAEKAALEAAAARATGGTNSPAKDAQTVAQLVGPKLSEPASATSANAVSQPTQPPAPSNTGVSVQTQGGGVGQTTGSGAGSSTVEPITIPSCAPGAARSAPVEQCAL